MKEDQVEDHQIHTEWYEVTAPVAEQINRARLEAFPQVRYCIDCQKKVPVEEKSA